MATQVESVVTTLGVTHLDFDIESSEETNTTDITRTAQALALVRQWANSNGDNLIINYTLPVLPTGLTSDGAPASFEIAGEDGKFVPATAKIEGSTVVVQAAGVTNPKYVRYGWAGWTDANLFNKDRLPASTFTSK